MHNKQFTASKTLALILTAGAMCTAVAAPRSQIAQAFSPAQYQALPIEQRQMYVAGALDTVRFFAPTPEFNELYNVCLAGTTIAQVTAVVDVRASHPEPIDQGLMPLIVNNSLAADCNRRGFKK
ncbi:hypothetical protein [Burkholderia contaminans]|uniref:hypothetical protein n=1 Tax=Burkholderia contaminans TaxID=488447 RepID=UPI003D67C7BC